MKYAYPVLIEQHETGYFTAEAPDLPGIVVGGDSLADALQAASDACAMWLADAENEGESIPAASDPRALAAGTSALVSVVPADTDEYRRKNDTRAVKKTLSLPAWMAEQAEKSGLSLSQVLQDALRAQLGV